MTTLKTLPASRCNSPCPRCCLLTTFLMFESGPGGDFGTYFGDTTGTLYRLDWNSIHYKGKTLDGLLAPAVALEGGIVNLRSIPEQIKCNSCGHLFSSQRCHIEDDDVPVLVHALA